MLCGWTLGPVPGGEGAILPDGCMDIVWREGRGLIAAGPDTGAGTRISPCRLDRGRRPLPPGRGAEDAWGPGERAARRARAAVRLWGEDAARLEERLEGAGSSAERLELIEDELRRRLPRAERPDRLVAAAVMRLYSNDPGRVRALADALGIGERQLRRRFHAAVGYGPKKRCRGCCGSSACWHSPRAAARRAATWRGSRSTRGTPTRLI